MNRATSLLSVLILAAAAVWPSRAENIINPPGSGWTDVTQSPYNADRTGGQDATSAIQDAINDNSGSAGNAYNCVYLPNGTYLVSGTLQYRTGNSQGPIMQGQSRKGTVIRLADGTFTGSGSTANPRAVLATGDGVAQNFNKGVYNLTVNIGSNNSGACGIYFYSNNEGLITDVDIISEDGQGDVGLHLGNGEQGPCMAQRIYVKGFRYGVWGDALNSVTLAQISVEGQSEYGFVVGGRTMYVDSLTSVNTVPAVYNESELVLINAFCTGGSPSSPAIRNEGKIIVRNVVAQGYQRAITSANPGQKVDPPQGTSIDEYSSYGVLSLFDSPPRTLNLPIKRPPDVEWEQDPAKWANINDYKTGGRSDAEALQAAIDDPAKTSVIFPPGWHSITEPVYVRGNIRRIVGPALIGCDWTPQGPVAGAFVVTDDLDVPVVKIERLNCQFTEIQQRSSKTVIAEAFTNSVPGPIGDDMLAAGSGDFFLIDVATRLKVTNPLAHVWAWQFNSEQQSYFWYDDYDSSQAYNLKVLGATVWVFGYKTEVYGTKAHVYGGSTEILGFYNYVGCHGGDTPPPTQFHIENANFSVAAATQLSFGCPVHDTLVTVVRDGVTRRMHHTQTDPVLEWETYHMPLFTNFDPNVGEAQRHPPGTSRGPAMAVRVLVNRTVLIAYAAGDERPVEVGILDSKGRVIGRRTGVDPLRGNHVVAMPVQCAGTYFAYVRIGEQRSVRTLLVVD